MQIMGIVINIILIMSTEHYSFNNDDRFSRFSATTDNIILSYSCNILMQLLRLTDEWFRRFYNDGWSRWAFDFPFNRCSPPISAMPCTAGNPTGWTHITAARHIHTLQQVVWRFATAVCPNRLMFVCSAIYTS